MIASLLGIFDEIQGGGQLGVAGVEIGDAGQDGLGRLGHALLLQLAGQLFQLGGVVLVVVQHIGQQSGRGRLGGSTVAVVVIVVVVMTVTFVVVVLSENLFSQMNRAESRPAAVVLSGPSRSCVYYTMLG